ncbi:MAG: isoleucine--tRNA ligase [Promethearchaeota archaeon]
MKKLPKFDIKKIEEEILDWWEKEKIYEEIKKKEPKDKVWRFIDGPPYTTGNVHLGTAWNKILKDYLIKYKRMRGYRVTDTPGYDTHGLPIEVLMEQQLGIRNKQEIYKYGLSNFIKACREHAEKQIPIMNEQFKRLGCTFWNWENPYITLKNTYIQGIWWTLKKAYEQGLLYDFYQPQNCCPRCSTALAKHEFEYKTIKDKAIFVKFKSVEDPKKFYLIWTTTPWTLVANTNVMANPDIEYTEVRVKDEIWVMAMAATANLLMSNLGLIRGEKDGFEYIRRFKGNELEGKRYIHPLAEEVPYQAELEKQQPKVHTIVLSKEYVQEGEGVGLVHTAPGHGPEDFEVGVANNIPIFSPVDMDGKYTKEGGVFEGKYVHEANEEIIEILRKKGTLIYVEEIEHEYAHCWRCKTKLVYRATEQWFFKTSALVNEMLKENESIYWIPEWAGSLNFRNWLRSLRDWCISRQRFWGIPLSIWKCDSEDCKNIHVIGSAEELKQKAGHCPDDLHRPFIDEVTWKCEKCGGTMRRIPDILDVWLDSGSVMWASQKFVDGYEHYDSWVPADFILEGKDQIRGWFNSLLCSAMVSSRRKNYNACYMHGWVLSHSIKMSKSVGNAIEPIDLIEGRIEMVTEEQKEAMRKIASQQKVSKFTEHKKTSPKSSKSSKSSKISKKSKSKKKHEFPQRAKYLCEDSRWSNVKGIETFRFFSVMSAQPGRDLNFDYREYVDTFKIINAYWNCYVFAQEKMALNNFIPDKHEFKYENLSLEDKWILSRTNSLVKTVTELFDKYFLPDIPQRLQDFIMNDLSRWYIMIIRSKVEHSSEDPNKMETLAVLWYVLYKLLLLLAPVNPMLSEKIYQVIFKEHLGKNAVKSIHLQKWPQVDEKYINEELENNMDFARKIVDTIRSLKSENKIKLRWPTKALYILPKENMPQLQFEDLVKEMCNVLKLEYIKEEPKGKILSAELPQCNLYLDLEDTKELQQLRILRDLLRAIQFLRKQNKFSTGEKIILTLSAENEFIKNALETYKDSIIAKVTADPLYIVSEPISSNNIGKDEIFHEFYLCLNTNCYASIREKQAKNILAGKKYSCNYCEKPVTKEKLGKIQIKFKRK